MTISYNWLSEYLPETIDPEKLSKILTSIGLEVESLEKYENIKGGLQGLVIGEVITCQPHENADKLKITTVNIGLQQPLQIVCGASNVAIGQKVVVAPVGTTIYPASTDAITMKIAKIRGIESHGMICAEDEIGLGLSHDGILVLPNQIMVGTPANEYFKPYSDFIFEIGLTPNRMDAMSHLGVAKDVCAYLTHHNKKEVKPINILNTTLKAHSNNVPIKVLVENTVDCPRYAALSISNITIKESPDWLKNKLAAIGVRSINNVVDVTNFILHETGQPLHAFDINAVTNNTVIVKNLSANTLFTTLDEKERKLFADDLIICNGNSEPMCIAGVFGGLKSGVQNTTTGIFLESACFNGISVRKTSLQHGLRTDAATSFEKGVDISNTVNVLKRAAQLIIDVAGGEISSDIVDVYTNPKEKNTVAIKYHYLKKLSGKNYHPDAVKRILTSLGFEILKEGLDELWVAVPYNKPDISLAADIVEEIIRIDGLDNIDIPTSITISPSIDTSSLKESLKEKIANYLVGNGFSEIFTNSITNSKYFSDNVLASTVKMMNNLSADLDILRPSMLETGLECIAYNINRKNTNLQFFEFGKVYFTPQVGTYKEEEKLALYLTGNTHEAEWKSKGEAQDFYRLKGIATAITTLVGLPNIQFTMVENNIEISTQKTTIGTLCQVNKTTLQNFDIKQPVFYLNLNIDALLTLINNKKIKYKEVSKFPTVQRDLAMVIDKNISYNTIDTVVQKTKLNKLQNVRLFDVFESEKLGTDKKSMAINFTFLDEEKTLTDKEIDGMMTKLIQYFEKELNAEIRK